MDAIEAFFYTGSREVIDERELAYQSIKARLMQDLAVDAPQLNALGILVNKPD